MTKNDSSASLDSIKVDQTNAPFLSSRKPAITSELKKLYLLEAGKSKSRINNVAAEIQQRQDKMKLINEIIGEINSLTDEKNSIDINKSQTLVEKLQVAKTLGVKIKEGQTTFSGIEKDRLVENLHLMRDTWTNENRQSTQSMEIHVKDMDRLMMIMKDVDRKEEQAKRASIKGISGG